MKAAVIDAFNRPLEMRDVAEPRCPVDGVIAMVGACGVCRSDWHGWNGSDPYIRLPHVPGHEFAGEVIEVGADCKSFKPGDRVTAPFILGCGVCGDCQRGEPTICATQGIVGFTSWGAFAEQIAVTRADFNLVRLPDALGYAAAAGMGCRVTTAFRALIDRARLTSDETLCVHGCGGIGLSAILIAKAIGARVIAVDVNRAALTYARNFGADILIDAGAADDVGQAVRDASDGGADVSIDALGITTTYQNSLQSLRKLGRHVQIGMPLGQHASPVLPLLDLVYSRQIEIIGTRGMAAHRFPTLFEMIADGRLDLGGLVSREIALSEAGAALAAMDGYTGAGISVITQFDR
jgi:alcohol dehydrogenase